MNDFRFLKKQLNRLAKNYIYHQILFLTLLYKTYLTPQNVLYQPQQQKPTEQKAQWYESYFQLFC